MARRSLLDSPDNKRHPFSQGCRANRQTYPITPLVLQHDFFRESLRPVRPKGLGRPHLAKASWGFHVGRVALSEEADGEELTGNTVPLAPPVFTHRHHRAAIAGMHALHLTNNILQRALQCLEEGPVDFDVSAPVAHYPQR